MNIALIDFIKKGYKFGIVGIISTIINYSVFALLYKTFELYYIFSSVMGYICGLSLGYLLNKYWTYIDQIDKTKSYIFEYFILYMISLFVSQLFLFSVVEIIFINPMYANILAIGLSTIMNFLGTNFFVFKKTENHYVL